ncbi:TRAP transporter small permease [uncultured Cloacibacillus sp.]|uniref:TRAP transporter small permease n=1 Tax=uncultured Cloacibacillus sp. TaxID=889794 RepID=UPI002602DAB3|nr:TRAP transporter small permease subunit [uncultured Cloacibacillus sp.]
MKNIICAVWKHFDDAITFVMFMGLFLTVLFQLVARVVFNSGFVWTEELSRLFLMYACFASIPRLIKKRSELKLTLFVDMLNRRNKLYFDIFVQILAICAFAFLTYWGFKTANFQSKNIMAAMRFSMFWMYVAFPLSMIAGIVRSIEAIASDIKQL